MLWRKGERKEGCNVRSFEINKIESAESGLCVEDVKRLLTVFVELY